MNPKRSVLVTGASGFVGRRLMRALVAAGHVTRRATARLDHEPLADAPSDVLVHLAGLTYVPDSWRDPLSFYETNVMGTLRVLDHCARHRTRLVFLSSYVYGPPDHLPVSEDAPRRPANPYMHSKILAEDCCVFYADKMGVDVLIVRPFNVYGPGQDPRFVIPSMVGQLLDVTTTQVKVADPNPRRDFLFVDDLIRLLEAAVASDAVGMVNAGSGRSYSIQEVFDTLVQITGKVKPLVPTGMRRQGEIMDVVADIGHACQLLDWRPTTTLSEGLRETIGALDGERDSYGSVG